MTFEKSNRRIIFSMPNTVHRVLCICIWITIVKCDLESLFQRCCDLGKSKSTDPLKCLSKIRTPIAGVAVEQQSICLSTIDLCCVQFLRDTACESGKQAAKQNKNCNVQPKTEDEVNYKYCCEACKLGMISSSMAMQCRLKTFRFNDPWDDVYESCCSEDTPNISQAEPTNICELLPGELCSHICVPVKGSYRCQCRSGFVLMADGKSCQQDTTENRCERYKICDQNCFDNGESLECSCNAGYELLADNKTCVDINECNLKLDNCYISGKTCKNTIGGYECEDSGYSNGVTISTRFQGTDVTSKTTTKAPIVCLLGYKYDAVTGQCLDIDECKIVNTCDRNVETCLNTPGSYRCVSKVGLLPTKVTANVVTPIPIKCGIGYVYNAQSNSCIDYDECKENPCESYEICENLLGSFTCNCKIGFQKDGVTGACVDINECQLRRHNCDQEHRCDNTVGSYQCVRSAGCGTGYTLNSQTDTCEDDNECVLGTDNCKMLGPSWECRNIVGSFRCEKKRCESLGTNCTNTRTTVTNCPKGYELVKGVCVDVDECQRRNPCQAGQSCVNTAGGFKCVAILTCFAGFKFNDDQTGCIDIDECAEQSRLCDHSCSNTLGSFRCYCNAGYNLHNDKRSCIDINECELYKDRRLCTGYCINTPGSYKCQCPDGYKLSVYGVTCDDIDECSSGNVCTKPNEVCLNTRGSYRCNAIICPSNYVQDSSYKNRCVRTNNFCMLHRNCEQLPQSYLFNYIAFPSNLQLPVSGQQNFYHMRASNSFARPSLFTLDLKNVQAAAGVNKTSRDYFRLTHDSANEVTVSLVRSIQGPQEIELDLKVEYTASGAYGAPFTVSKLFIYVSQYDF